MIVLNLLCLLSTASPEGQDQVPSVSLTVEGGVSLVGEHCPGTVRLFCEGVELTILRWRYNKTSTIHSFTTTSVPIQSTPRNPAFVKAELINVTQTPNDARFAAFYSILIVDITQLQAQNIKEISCGDPGTIASEPVDVVIQQPAAPNNPVITAVTVTYSISNRLENISIRWKDTDNYCPDYSNLKYQVNITTEISILVDHRNCIEEMCVANAQLMGNENESIEVTVMAINDFGASSTISYPTIIDPSEQYFFTPNISLMNSVFKVECVSVFENQTCKVRYTTDPMLTGLSPQFMTPLEIPVHDANITFYFEFSLLVNSSLKIVQWTNFTVPRMTTDMIDVSLTVSIIFVIIIMLVTPAILFILIKRCRKIIYKKKTASYTIALQ